MIFPQNIVSRLHDGESQDIEMTPAEADVLADLLRHAARKGSQNMAISPNEAGALADLLWRAAAIVRKG